MAHNTLVSPVRKVSSMLWRNAHLELAIQLTITIGRRIVPGSRHPEVIHTSGKRATLPFENPAPAKILTCRFGDYPGPGILGIVQALASSTRRANFGPTGKTAPARGAKSKTLLHGLVFLPGLNQERKIRVGVRVGVLL